MSFNLQLYNNTILYVSFNQFVVTVLACFVVVYVTSGYMSPQDICHLWPKSTTEAMELSESNSYRRTPEKMNIYHVVSVDH